MSKKQKHQIVSQKIEKNFDKLCKQLAKAENPISIQKFLESLLTESEIIMLSRRIEIAELLLNGKNHEEICKRMKVGAITVRSVNKTLRSFLENSIRKNKSIYKRISNQKEGIGTFDYIRKTYKGYFSIINLFLD